MNKFLLLTLLALGYQSASAQIFTKEIVPDTGFFGTSTPYVAYPYFLGKYEISRGQIEQANAAGDLGITMADMSARGGDGVNRPATGISWYEAAKFVNWLNTSQGHHKAYNFIANGTFQLWSSTDAGYNPNNMFRNSLAKYVIPNTFEWWKGAYGNIDGRTTNAYPNGSAEAPTKVSGGTAPNTAVYGQSSSTGPADITNAGGLSPWGTMAQGGNASEWMEGTYDNIGTREWRGGSYYSNSDGDLEAGDRRGDAPTAQYADFGFRVAYVNQSSAIPEPSTGLLVVLGLSGLLLKRRKTGTL